MPVTLDQTIFLAVQSLNNTILDFVSQWISRITGSPVFWLGLIGLLAIISWQTLRRTFWVLVAAFGLEIIVVEMLLKPFVHRSRPFWVLVSARVIDPVYTSYSFPSGHTAVTSAALWVVGSYFPKLRWPAILVVILVGLSRIYNGVHWPSDVFGGIAIGCLIGWLTMTIQTFVKRKVK